MSPSSWPAASLEKGVDAGTGHASGARSSSTRLITAIPSRRRASPWPLPGNGRAIRLPITATCSGSRSRRPPQGRQAGRPLNLVLLSTTPARWSGPTGCASSGDALRVLARNLQPQDKLSVITFARTARLWVDGHAGQPSSDWSSGSQRPHSRRRHEPRGGDEPRLRRPPRAITWPAASTAWSC